MAGKIIVTYDGYQIDPAPSLSINKEFIYANDTIIGYKYVLTINGYGSSFNKKLGQTESNLSTTIVSLLDIRNILMRNGRTLNVVCDNGNVLLTAYGGLLRSFDVAESPNRMSQYAPFSVVMDFNEVQFTDAINTEINRDSLASDSPTLNEALRHLQSYNDSWNFTIGEEDMYRYYSRITPKACLILKIILLLMFLILLMLPVNILLAMIILRCLLGKELKILYRKNCTIK